MKNNWFYRYNFHFHIGDFVHFLPVVSGVLLILTLPPLNLSLLSWIALVPLLFYIKNNHVTPRQSFQGGFFTGFIYFARITYPLLSLNAWGWFNVTGSVHENKILLLFWVLYFATVLTGTIFGSFCFLYRRFGSKKMVHAILFAVLWVLFEFFRAKILLGFTWGHLGYSLHNEISILQLAGVFGVYGLSFLIVLVNFLGYFFVRDTSLFVKKKGWLVHDKVSFSRIILWNRFFLLLIVILSGAYITGVFLGNHRNSQPREGSLRTTVIQPVSMQFDRAAHLALIKEAFAENPDLIVSPTGAFLSLIIDRTTNLPVGYDNDPAIKNFYDQLRNLSLEHPRSSFVIDMPTIDTFGKYESMIILEKGEIAGIYDKIYLMPFSESLFSDTKIKPGGENQHALIHGVPVIPLICSEVIFPELLKKRDTIQDGFIINIGTDGVFDSPLVAEQDHIMAILRAVESGKYLVRAMNTGISSVIDPLGRELVKTRVGVRGEFSTFVSY